MSSHRISHIALHVESLRQAATFYARLFDLQVLRLDEPRGSESPHSAVMPAHEESPGGEMASARCLLGRNDFRLALRDDEPESAGNGRVAHIGVQVLAGDLEGLRLRAGSLGCRILQRGPQGLLLEDVYGICWHVTADGSSGLRRSEAETP